MMHPDDPQTLAQVSDEAPLAPAADTPGTPAALGNVFSVGGSHVLVRFSTEAMGGENAADLTVGVFLGIWTRHSLAVGVLADISSEPGAGAQAVGRVDLLGEIVPSAEGPARFERGVRSYPTIGNRVVPIGHAGLRIIFDLAGANTINVGELQQDRDIGAYINVDDMVRKHFALLGSTGAGKSSAVALVLRQIMQVRPDLRIVLIDPHNEYGRSFDDQAHVVGPSNLVLPFWLLNFDELIEIVFGRRRDAEEEIGLLSELIPLAKATYQSQRAGARTSYRAIDPQGPGYTVDTPVPYRMDDLVALIENRMGKLENRAIALQYQRLLLRMNAIRKNPRYGFLFDEANGGEDSMVDVLCRLLRLQQDGQPLTVLQLAGFPAEVLDVIVSVLFRMAFDFGLWSDGALPVLMVCEEAHHYGHPDPEVGFGPARDAMARIAKEGRKYGVFLGLVTQRPAELDPTLISQCNTVFAMRMANERDQAIVRAAVSDAGSRLLSFLPSLGTREVLAFGEGIPIPARLRFAELPEQLIPRSEAIWCGRVDGQAKLTKSFVATVVERWRGARVSIRPQQAPETAPKLDSFFVPVESGGAHVGASYRK